MTVPAAQIGHGSEGARFRRALSLIGMTLLLPGSAQLARGNRAVGRVALLVHALLLAGAAAGYLRLGIGGLVQLSLQSWLLVAGQLAALVVGLCWLALFTDAWRLGLSPSLTRAHRLAGGGLSLALMSAVAVPLAYGAHLLGVQRGVIDDLLVPGGPGILHQGRLNILLLGGDGGPYRTGIRTDSLTVASVDATTGRTVLFGVPRNMQGVRFPPGTAMAAQFPDGFPDFLFGVYTYGAEHPNLFPGVSDPGAEAIKQGVAQTLGIPLPYYVLMNAAGFQSVVDALGGVTLRVGQRLPIGGGTTAAGDSRYAAGAPLAILGHIEPGLQKLDGYQALWYARSRSSTTDYDRMARQRCVLGAILREADPLTVLTNYRALAASAKKVIRTDLTTGALGELVSVAVKTQRAKVTSLQLNPPLVRSVDPDIDAIHALVSKAFGDSVAPPSPQIAAAQASTPAPGDARDLDGACRYS